MDSFIVNASTEQDARLPPSMRIGFNFTQGAALPLIQRLLAERHIDFCEILIDNFVHLPPVELKQAFDGCAVGFHIMQSRFLESDSHALESLSARLRLFIDAMQPLYVSDHLALFSHDGRELHHLAEINYRADRKRIFERVVRWQDQLGCPLLLENFPSIMDGAHDAPSFFEDLHTQTGAGLLFDISNAICAMRNSGARIERWLPLIARSQHFHVAGYAPSIMQPPITLDTHDSPLAADTMDFLRSHAAEIGVHDNTLTYERDGNLDEASIVADLHQLREISTRAAATTA
jgi:methanobactin biosynthesis cassette protein MbnB